MLVHKHYWQRCAKSFGFLTIGQDSGALNARTKPKLLMWICAGQFKSTINCVGRDQQRPTFVFVCFAVKAVHLEVVSDLTTEAFLPALKRFIGRRGLPVKLFSDNATNFVGANNQFRRVYELFSLLEHREAVQKCSVPTEAFNESLFRLGRHILVVYERRLLSLASAI